MDTHSETSTWALQHAIKSYTVLST
ncbi:uncharacterized protein METZ01_LOCUS87719 [marine metagenome]|uniref:Uncharacterized protein n=1 Tax=marine metagenome TaxID=408172 RepID=A0A381V3D3_9ZZZZ